MLINCHCNAAKVSPNTNRQILAGNNLEYNKLKASTLTLLHHSGLDNGEATLSSPEK